MTAESNQGEGTYDYECRKPGCFACAAFGTIPKPGIYFEPKVITIDPIYENAPPRKAKPIIIKKEKLSKVQFPKKELWPVEKVEYLTNNYHRLSNIDLYYNLHISIPFIIKKAREIGLARKTNIRVSSQYRSKPVLENEFGGWF